MWNRIANAIENSGVMILSAVIIILVSVVLHRIIKRALNLLEKQGKLEAPVVSSLKFITRWLFFIATFLLLLQTIGVLQNVWAALLAIVAAVAVGFVAEWSLLSNILSTLLVLIYRPFKIGDVVEIPDHNVKGEVIDINFFYSTLKVSDIEVVQIPNKTYFFKPIVRAYGEETISLYNQLKSDKPSK